jgi:hypothetical protein
LDKKVAFFRRKKLTPLGKGRISRPTIVFGGSFFEFLDTYSSQKRKEKKSFVWLVIVLGV